MKTVPVQRPTPRTPRQERAQHKVALILEGAIRLLDKGGLPLLTTNAVAQKAGVSIGTLYQYFPNKEAILDALADRETAVLSERLLGVLRDLPALPREERIGRIVRAIMSSYQGRRRVHRLVMEYSFSHGGRRLAPLIERIIAFLTTREDDDVRKPMNEAEAFVLANAVAGVMRAAIMRADDAKLPQIAIEEAVGRLIAGFVDSLA